MSEEVDTVVADIEDTARQGIETLESLWAQRLADAVAVEQQKFADHMALPAPAGHMVVDPPPIHTVLLGASYGSGATKTLYNRRPQSARIFYDGNIPGNVASGTMFQEAYGAGIRDFVFSYRGTQSVDTVANCVRSVPSDCNGEWCYFHEPEDNVEKGTLNLAAWVARTKRDAPVIRSAGGTPVVILQAFTLTRKRNIHDYDVDGAVDYRYFDYYMNPDEGKDDPEGKVAQAVQAAIDDGAKGTGFPEVGVPNFIDTGVAVDLIKRLRTTMIETNEVTKGHYWSSKSFIFNESTANAWFEGN